MHCQQINENVPDAFICPLTLEIMEDPVMNRAGHSFERAAIIEWMRKENPTCPLTRKPIRLSDFVANRRLQHMIVEWRTRHGEDVSECASEEAIIDGITSKLPVFGSISNVREVTECNRLRRPKVPSALRSYHLLQ
jgi:U-box domain